MLSITCWESLRRLFLTSRALGTRAGDPFLNQTRPATARRLIPVSANSVCECECVRETVFHQQRNSSLHSSAPWGALTHHTHRRDTQRHTQPSVSLWTFRLYVCHTDMKRESDARTQPGNRTPVCSRAQRYTSTSPEFGERPGVSTCRDTDPLSQVRVIKVRYQLCIPGRQAEGHRRVGPTIFPLCSIQEFRAIAFIEGAHRF